MLPSAPLGCTLPSAPLGCTLPSAPLGATLPHWHARHGHQRSTRGDLLSLALPPIEVSGIQVNNGMASLLQRPAEESLDLLINLLSSAESPEIPRD